MTQNKISVFVNKKNKPTDPDLSGTIKNEAGEIINKVVLWKNTSQSTGIEYYSGYINELPANETTQD